MRKLTRPSLGRAVVLATVLLSSGCGGSGSSGGEDYTLHVDVTSSGTSIPFTGTVKPNHGAEVSISGTTPFSQQIRDRRTTCDQPLFGIGNPCLTAALATVQKTTKTTDSLTVCLRNGEKACSSSGSSSDAIAFLNF